MQVELIIQLISLVKTFNGQHKRKEKWERQSTEGLLQAKEEFAEIGFFRGRKYAKKQTFKKALESVTKECSNLKAIGAVLESSSVNSIAGEDF